MLLDRDIARVYGVETRDINKAVANNPDKFPAGYLFELTKMEKTELVENFHRFEKLKRATVKPKAFTEKGHDSEKPGGYSGHTENHRDFCQAAGAKSNYPCSF